MPLYPPPGGGGGGAGDVSLSAGNTYTAGRQDFRLAANGLYLPESAGFAPATASEVGWDTTQRTMESFDGMLAAAISRVLSVQNSTADTMSAATTTNEQAFATTFTVPANYLIAGKALRLTALFQITTSGTAPSLTVRVRLGGLAGTLIASTNTSGPGNNLTNRGLGAQWLIQGTAAAGAAAAVETGILVGIPNTPPFTGNFTAQTVAVATNASQALTLTAQWSATTAGNSLTLRQFILEELN